MAWARRPARPRVAGGKLGADQTAAFWWESSTVTVGSPAMLIAARQRLG
jgi:hypothetical protein